MKRRCWKIFPYITVTVLFLSGCAGGQEDRSAEGPILLKSETNPQEKGEDFLLEGRTEETVAEKMTLQIGDSAFTATLESNASVDALVGMMSDAPVTIQMSDYSGFEKVGSLGTSLPADDSRTTTHAGDIVLYNGNQIVIFYGSNSWSYTRLGKIDDLSGWEDALGSGDVTVTFSLG